MMMGDHSMTKGRVVLVPFPFSDVMLDPGQDDFARTGLRVASILRLHRLMTVTAGLIQRELGELSPLIQNEIAGKLRKLFALA